MLPVSQVAPFPVETRWVHEIAGVPMKTYIDWMASCYAHHPDRPARGLGPRGLHPRGTAGGAADRGPAPAGLRRAPAGPRVRAGDGGCPATTARGRLRGRPGPESGHSRADRARGRSRGFVNDKKTGSEQPELLRAVAVRRSRAAGRPPRSSPCPRGSVSSSRTSVRPRRRSAASAAMRATSGWLFFCERWASTTVRQARRERVPRKRATSSFERWPSGPRMRSLSDHG